LSLLLIYCDIMCLSLLLLWNAD